MTGTPPDHEEARHPLADERHWNESWYFDFTTEDGSFGGWARVGLAPGLGGVWYHACVVGEGRPLVLVDDTTIAIPAEPSLEIRSDGLWADHTCEEPWEHWTLGLEAFGVALDDPTEAYRGARGDRTPLGFDLEWETDGEVYRYDVTDRYEIPCRVHGEILVGDERIDFDGVGQRDHSWATRDWWAQQWVWTSGRLADATRFHGVQVRIPGAIEWPFGYVQRPGQGCDRLTAAITADEDLGTHDLPDGARLGIGDLTIDVAPVAFSPVHLVDPHDGRVDHFPRALCRYTTADGRSGVGWTEWNQPQ